MGMQRCFWILSWVNAKGIGLGKKK